MNNFGNVVNSMPAVPEDKYYKNCEDFIHFNKNQLLPTISQNALKALDSYKKGSEPTLVEKASLRATNIIAPLGSEVIRTFPMTSTKIYEQCFIRESMGPSFKNPESVLITGAGERLPEIYALMDPPLDLDLAEERAKILKSFETENLEQEIDTPPVIVNLPKRIHCSDPFSQMSAIGLLNGFGKFFPKCEIAPSDKLDPTKEEQILLTDDSHSSLIANYRPKSFDLVELLRFDPNSLIPSGVFEFGKGLSAVRNSYHAINMLTDLVRLIRPGGHAIISVGLGNNSAERMARLAIINGFENLLNTFKIETTTIINPLSNMIFPGGVKTEDEEKVLDAMVGTMAIQTLVVPYSARIESVKDELRNPGVEGCGSVRYIKIFQKAQIEGTKKIDSGYYDF